MKKVLLLGAGLVTKPLVDYLIDEQGYQVTMAARTVAKGEKVVASRELGRVVGWASHQEEELSQLVQDHDIVVNMIPKSQHVIVARACLKHQKNMITTSHEIPPIRALDAEARERGILILNELGEDPGMDHLAVQTLLEGIRNEGGRVISLHSYGAGLPSFKYNNNPLGYKFSWDPKGMFLSAQAPAVHVVEGKPISIPGNQLFENHSIIDIEGLGTFERYPNRDVTIYAEPYGLEPDVTLFRGLLRFSGHCNNMRSFFALDLLNDVDQFEFQGKTFRDFAASLIGKENTPRLEQDVADFLKVDGISDIMNRLGWLGLFEEEAIRLERGSRLDVFVELLLKKLTYAPGETDMTIIHVEIVADFPDARRERRTATMVKDGTPHGDSAMAKAVGFSAAIGAKLVLEGQIQATGVRMPPNLPELREPLMQELKQHGFEYTFRTQTLS